MRDSRQYTSRRAVNKIVRFQVSDANSLLSLFYRIIPDMVNVKPCLLHYIPVVFEVKGLCLHFKVVLHFIVFLFFRS